FPRQQQDQAPLPAQPAIAPVLGRKRKPLGAPARFRQRASHDRQTRHRRRAGRTARPRRIRLSPQEPNMAKGIREKIKLESTAGTGHFYTTTKNKRNMPEKMIIKKYDPVARKHVEYKETKLK